MKLQLFIDSITKKIIGYNKFFTDTDLKDKDNIFIEGDMVEKLFQIGLNDKLYYIDGTILEKNIPDDYEKNLLELEEKRKLQIQLVQNENQLFMDNLIQGLSIEESTKQLKENREFLKESEIKLKELIETHKQDIMLYEQNKFQEEEKERTYNYYVSILLLIRDENEYLEEWLEHFINVLNVDHIYLYDNESSVPVKSFLTSLKNPYLDKITFVDWKSTKNTQEDACNHFLETYGTETKWIAPIDTDEFIQMNHTKTLKEFLMEHEQYASILCQWVHYNANGQEKKTAGSVMERFPTIADWYNWKSSGKKFIQTNRCNRFSRYNPVLRRNCLELDNEKNNKDSFQLNHYITKSYEEWKKKIQRGSCDPNVLREYKLFFELNPDMSYLNTEKNFTQGYGSNLNMLISH